MSYKILWTSEAFSTFEDRISYLQIHFTDREINNFKKRVGSYLLALSEEPLIGKRTGRQKGMHIGLVIKTVSLIYRVNRAQKTVELISFFDNRQDPKKLKRIIG